MSRGDWTRYPSPSRDFHRTAEWKRVRRMALARDQHQCRLRLSGCTDTATQVDLIVLWHRGGVPELANCASVCESCHRAKTLTEAREAKRTARRRRPVHPADVLTGGEIPPTPGARSAGRIAAACLIACAGIPPKVQ